MTFAKPDKKTDNNIDPDAHLYCSVAGCTRRWSVKIDRRFCSQHAWQEDKQYEKPKFDSIAEKIPENAVYKSYYEKDEDF